MEKGKAISVKNLTKKFDSFSAVNNISFDVEEGKMFAFLGPNGAGKTTTIKMLTTILHPTSGKIRMNGFEIGKDNNEIRKSFGIVFQDFSLDDELTALENLEFHGILYKVPKDLLKKRIETLLKLVDLYDKKNNFVKTFSGGMKRRLEIARALVHHPRILFLDEPTAGLDPQTRNNMWNYIKRLSKEEKMTVFFTTHYMEEAEKMAEEVAIIDHGKIVFKEPPSEIKKKTKSKSLEDAFLKLTGHDLREEEASSLEILRAQRKVWRR